MQTTENYGLRKPEVNEFFNVEDFNHNADVVDEKVKEIETKSDLLTARLNVVESLPEGSTNMDAEVIDIRVGADGKTYDNAGEAVRGQIGDLKSDLGNYVPVEGVREVKPYNMQIFDIDGNIMSIVSLLKSESYITNGNGKISFTESINWSSYIVPIEEKEYRISKPVRCAVVASDKETIIGDVVADVTTIDCTGGSYLAFSLDTGYINDLYIVDSGKEATRDERFNINDEYSRRIFVNGVSVKNLVAVTNGGEAPYNFSLSTLGYYNNNLELVDTTGYTDFLAEKINVVGCEKIDLTVYAMSSSFCGFVTADGEVIETWHENGLTTKQVPPTASYLCVSHTLNRGVEFPSLSLYYKGVRTIYSSVDGMVDSLEKIECRYKPTTKLHGVKWSANGDSITSNQTGWSYVPVVAEMLGIDNFVNNGVGGARFNQLSGQALSETADIITLFAGTNDFGSSDGATELTTFKSNVESVIDSIKNGTDSRLYVISPIPRFDKSVNSIDLTLLDYVKAISEVCVSKKVPFLNLYEQIDITENNYARYLVDKLHPTTEGKYRIAECIAKFISDMECIYRMVSTY